MTEAKPTPLPSAEEMIEVVDQPVVTAISSPEPAFMGSYEELIMPPYSSPDSRPYIPASYSYGSSSASTPPRFLGTTSSSASSYESHTGFLPHVLESRLAQHEEKGDGKYNKGRNSAWSWDDETSFLEKKSDTHDDRSKAIWTSRSDGEKGGSYIIDVSSTTKENKSKWGDRFFFLSPLTLLVSQGTGFAYVYFRARYTIEAQNATHVPYVSTWVFLFVELSSVLTVLLFSVWCLFVWNPQRRPNLRLLGMDDLPTVDCFVCSCGEPLDVIMDTAKSAVAFDYPIDKFRVLVLDDAGSDELKHEVETYAARFAPNLIYTRRYKEPGKPHHAKAGNINAALELTKSLTWGWQGAGEFTLSLDADMIARPDMVRGLLPHLVRDDNVCLSGSPQAFYNIPKGDPLAQDLQTFFKTVEPLKDRAGVAWCTGSGFAMRRSVLDLIGGFPVGSLAEDVYCSSLMLGQGYKCIFVNEPLQMGLVPDSFAGHLKQRTRWSLGTMENTKLLNWFLWGKRIKGMTLLQRFCGLTFATCTMLTIINCASFVIFPFVLLSGGNLVPASAPHQLKMLIRLVFAHLITSRLHEMIFAGPSSIHALRREQLANSWMAPYHARTIVRSVLPKWLGGAQSGFKASGSISDSLHERDATKRAPMYRRFWFMVTECSIWMHILILGVTLGGVGLALYRTFNKYVHHEMDVANLFFRLLLKIFWPPCFYLVVMVGLFVPIGYTIHPPSVPERSEFIEYSGGNKAIPRVRPEMIADNKWTNQWGLQFTLDLVLAYTTALFVLTFILSFDVAPSALA